MVGAPTPPGASEPHRREVLGDAPDDASPLPLGSIAPAWVYGRGLANRNPASFYARPMAERHFPPPWTVVETPDGYRVDDATGQTIGWFYGADETSRQTALRRLTRAEALQFAKVFARLPELPELLAKDPKPAN